MLRSVRLLPQFVSLFLFLFALSSQASTSAPAGDDVDQWLARMADALRHENYAGIFTYMRGTQFDTIEVVHGYQSGEEVERLLHLNGEKREIIRRGDEVICRHEHDGEIDLHHHVPLGPFSHAFNQNLAESQSFYDIALMGEDRVANRPAVKLAITPRFDDRWGYRLWLDKQSGLLLQSHLVGRGRVLEIFQFSQITIGEPVTAENLQASLPTDAPSHRLTPVDGDAQNSGLAQNNEQAAPQWRASWVPTGFRQVPSPRPNRIVFTDGIATFSIFIERGRSNGRPEFGTLMGGTAVITRQLKGSADQITVVGEVPIDTAKKVAESIEPVVY